MSKLKTSLLTVIIFLSVFVLYVIYVTSGRAVGIDVQYVGAEGGCDDQNPVLVTITNRMPFKINYYSFQVSAKRDGYSTDVRHDQDLRGSDKIIPAFGSDRLCWYSPKGGNTADAYSAISKYGSLDAAKKGIVEEQNKENPSLQWSGKIKLAVWDFDIRYNG